MGRFDSLKQDNPDEPESNAPSLNYALAHLALKSIALGSPLQFLAIVASPDSKNFFDSIIDDIVEQMGCSKSFDSSEIQVYNQRVNDFPCAIIKFPDPQKITEAHMVAVIAEVNLNEGFPKNPDSVQARFLTLEKGYSESDQSITVLGEWSGGTHLNFGEGPEPSIEAFLETLSQKLE